MIGLANVRYILRIEYASFFFFSTADSCSQFIFNFFAIFLKVWALQDGTTVVIGGKTNRAKGEFPDEINGLLNRVPELVENFQKQSIDSMSG